MNSQPIPSGPQLLSDAFRMYGERWKVLLAAAALQLPSLLLGKEDSNFWVAAVSLILFFISQPVVLSAVASEDLPGDALGPVFSRGLSLFLSFAWIAFLVGISVMGASVLLLIPGIILSFYLSLSQFVLVSENKRGMSALLGSWGYIQGRGWRAFMRILFLMLIVFLLAFIQSFISVVLSVGQAAGSQPHFLLILLPALLQVLLVPVFPLYLFSFFKSLRATVVALPTPEEDAYRRKILIAAAVLGVLSVIALVFFAGVGVMANLGAYGGEAGSIPLQ